MINFTYSSGNNLDNTIQNQNLNIFERMPYFLRLNRCCEVTTEFIVNRKYCRCEMLFCRELDFTIVLYIENWGNLNIQYKNTHY